MEDIEEQVDLPTVQSEAKEANIQQLAPFLGGLFSIGGRMGFNTENQIKRLKAGETQYTYAYPVITYNDNRKTKIDRL